MITPLEVSICRVIVGELVRGTLPETAVLFLVPRTATMGMLTADLRTARAPITHDERSDMRDKVLQTIDVMRPALQADGGDIVLHDVNEETGVVTVELIGACVGCSSSAQTLKAGVERILRDRVEGVTEVVEVSTAALGDIAS